MTGVPRLDEQSNNVAVRYAGSAECQLLEPEDGKTDYIDDNEESARYRENVRDVSQKMRYRGQVSQDIAKRDVNE